LACAEQSNGVGLSVVSGEARTAWMSAQVGSVVQQSSAMHGFVRHCLPPAQAANETNERTNERIGQIRSEHQNAEEEQKSTQNADRKIEQKDRAGANSTILGVI
jgi:ribosomal protein L9